MERRTFIKGVAASSILGIAATDLQAGTSKKYADNRGTLRGKEFFLDIDYTPVNITGKRSVATTINGQIPGPTLVWQEGDELFHTLARDHPAFSDGRCPGHQLQRDRSG